MYLYGKAGKRGQKRGRRTRTVLLAGSIFRPKTEVGFGRPVRCLISALEGGVLTLYTDAKNVKDVRFVADDFFAACVSEKGQNFGALRVGRGMGEEAKLGKVLDGEEGMLFQLG